MASSTDPEAPPQAPIARKEPPAGKQFPCKNCGAKLDFDPTQRALSCPYCGHVERIAPSEKAVQNTDWNAYWAKHGSEEGSIEGRSSQVKCRTCGAVVLLEDKVATDRCPYCACFLENKPEAAQAMIPPAGLLPFKLAERDARDAFNRWIRSLWFAPSSLCQFANLGRLSGVYVPFWTFDSMTYTHYQGQRGDDYTETETYQETNANGQVETKTRQVTRTRWTRVSGEVQHYFENVLICASRGVAKAHIHKLGPWDLPVLEGFRDDYLSGFQTERYTIGLRDGFDQARNIMDGEIRTLCAQDIGGDHQTVETVQTQYAGVAFKHILLPAWLAAYRYNDQPYQVVVNGRTGKVIGDRPYSWIKIAFLMLMLLAIAVAVFLFATRAHGAEARVACWGARVPCFRGPSATWQASKILHGRESVPPAWPPNSLRGRLMTSVSSDSFP